MSTMQYNLTTGRIQGLRPQLRYSDRIETWAITCIGRSLRNATSWRAVISTARVISSSTVIARINSGITVSDAVISIPVNVFFAEFRDAVAEYEKGRELWFALWASDGNATVEYLEFSFTGFPSIDPPGDDPNPLPATAPYTTINGLSRAVILADSAGNALPVDDQKILLPANSNDEGSSFYPPVANYLVNDATYGAVYYLDSTIPSIVFAERVLNLKKVRLRLVSANAAVTGNIVIVPAVDGVDQAPITLAIGASEATIDFEFTTAVTGRFSLRRDYAATADTLDNVTAITTALRILEV